MKLKKLLLISMFLFVIISIGAVSSANNFTSYEMASSDVGDELAVESNDEIVAQESDEEYHNPNVYIYDSVNVDESYNDIANVFDDKYIDGNVYATIDDVTVLNKTFYAKQEEYYCVLSIGDLQKIPSFRKHKVNLTYKKFSNQTFSTVKYVDFTYQFYVGIGGESADSFEREYGKLLDIEVRLPEKTTGKLVLTLNGKSYTPKVEKVIGGYSRAYVKIATENFKIKTYVLKAQFTDSSKKYPKKTISVPITIVPKLFYYDSYSTGEKDNILITAPKNSQLYTIVSILDEINNTVQKKKFSAKGLVKIPVTSVLKNGVNHILLNYSCGDVKSGEDIYIYMVSNDKFKVSVSNSGKTAKVSIAGPKNIFNDIDIYLDNIHVKSGELKNGKFNYKLSKLSVCKHKINVKINGEKIYSNTYFVTVKSKISLTLNKVNVKKSAKKLVLKATLKINKKAKKGLKVTFKFNGKTYTAKTNKKGVAKVTVKKNILKKLKIGKKVRYQVKYSSKTVKRTVKVKV